MENRRGIARPERRQGRPGWADSKATDPNEDSPIRRFAGLKLAPVLSTSCIAEHQIQRNALMWCGSDRGSSARTRLQRNSWSRRQRAPQADNGVRSPLRSTLPWHTAARVPTHA